MKTELVPVIEIGHNSQRIAKPDRYPYWENPEIWDLYHRNCLSEAGYSTSLKPYLPGYSLYTIASIGEADLIKIITEHTDGIRQGKYAREGAAALAGGYILRIDGKDAYFPQCCGELSDIYYWEDIASGNTESYYEGHPRPLVTTQNDFLIFDFTVEEYDEPFQPTPPGKTLTIDPFSLQKAVIKAKEALTTFSSRLKEINIELNWEIDNIEGLLVWENPNRP